MSPEEIPSKPHLHPTFMTALRQRWEQGTPQAGRILDLGCGDGRLSLQLVGEASASGAFVEWVGTDVCSEAVDHARRLARQQGVRGRLHN
jgi:methylase of polypeptide subunit release factors